VKGKYFGLGVGCGPPGEGEYFGLGVGGGPPGEGEYFGLETGRGIDFGGEFLPRPRPRPREGGREDSGSLPESFSLLGEGEEEGI